MRIANLHNVTTHYGAQPVLTGASFEINSGQKLGLIGPNGSGKTTILKVLTGREPVTGGSVYLDPGARVGYVPQHFEHDTDSTVIDWLLSRIQPNCRCPPRPGGDPRALIRRRHGRGASRLPAGPRRVTTASTATHGRGARRRCSTPSALAARSGSG